MVITSHFNVTVSALFASVLMIMMVMYWQDQRVFAKQQSVLSLVCQLPIVSIPIVFSPFLFIYIALARRKMDDLHFVLKSIHRGII